jgi:hypothetical protein
MENPTTSWCVSCALFRVLSSGQIKIVRDSQGDAASLRLVGIDNDRVFGPSIRQNKGGAYYPGVKSIVFLLPQFQEPLGMSSALLLLWPLTFMACRHQGA